MVDNYDSFTYNLVQYLGELGAEPEVGAQRRGGGRRAARAAATTASSSRPGPCTPNEAGISVEVMRRFPEAGVPTLGVCLGHQSLVQAFGGRVVRHVPVHGKATEIEHDGRGLFAGLPSPLTVGRYHSLVGRPRAARRPRGRPRAAAACVMAVRHRELPAHGVQFHPESVLTPDGKRLLENFLA